MSVPNISSSEPIPSSPDDATLIGHGFEPVVVEGKAPVVDDWQVGPMTLVRIQAERTAFPNAVNTGLRCGRLVGIDIDLHDEVHVERIVTRIEKVLGLSEFVRIGSKGQLLCYWNTEEPLRKITVTYADGVTADGRMKRKAAVEVLGVGQQFVGYGRHPDTGKNYEWPNAYLGCEPLQSPMAELPKVTGTKVREVADAISDELTKLGYDQVRIGGLRKVEPRVAANDTEFDTEAAIAKATIYLANQEPLIDGAQSDNESYKIFAQVRQWGISETMAVDLVDEYCGKFCDTWWLEEKAANAYRYAQNEAGCDPVKLASETFDAEKLQAKVANDTAPDDDLGLDAPDAPTFADDEEPLDLFEDHGEPVAFPSDALPPVIEAFATDVAARKGVEIAPVAITALAVCAAALHTNFKIQHTPDGTWTERPVLWTMLVGSSSAGKSPVLTECTKPLEEAAGAAFEKSKAAMAQYLRDKKKRESDEKAGRANITVTGPGADDVMKGALLGPEPKVPPMERIIVDDTTSEALAKIIAENVDERGILSLQDELAKWLGSFDAYKATKGAERPALLKAFDSKPWIVDRKGAETLHINRASVSVLGGIQPKKLNPMLKSLAVDGLFQRFMVVPMGPKDKGMARQENLAALGAYHGLVKRLTTLRPGDGAGAIQLSPEAKVEWSHVEEQIEAAIEVHAEAHDELVEHLNKWHSVAARLLLTMHAIDCATAPRPADDPFSHKLAPIVSGETARRAARLVVDYLILTAERFYLENFEASAERSDAEKVAEVVLAHPRLGRMETIKPRDIYNARHEFRDAGRKALQDAMRTLEEWGWVRTKTMGSKGEVTEWWVNPRVFDRYAERAEATRKRNAERLAKMNAAFAVRSERKQQQAGG